MATDKKRYVLKKDIKVFSTITEKYYTAENCTDEEAVSLLATSPDLIDQFDTYPQSWKTEVEAIKPVVVIEQEVSDEVDSTKSKKG